MKERKNDQQQIEQTNEKRKKGEAEYVYASSLSVAHVKRQSLMRPISDRDALRTPVSYNEKPLKDKTRSRKRKKKKKEKGKLSLVVMMHFRAA